MVVGTIAGVESGAQVIQTLKRAAHVDWVVGLTFVLILLGISGFMTGKPLRRRERIGDRFQGTSVPS